MKIQIEVQGPQWLARSPRRARRVALATVAILVLGIPAAVWASDRFADVPIEQPFHNQISAIAGAGITTGCGGGNYCPDDFVRRDAMAAFMHRGYGRMRWVAPAEQSAGATSAVFTHTITPGLPSGALAGAAGFVKTDGSITLEVTDNTSCPCTWIAFLEMDGVGGMTSWFTRVTLDITHPHITVPITGGIRVTTPGEKTVRLTVARQSGSGSAVVRPTLSTTYYPFGGAGTNVLGISVPTGPLPEGAAPSDR